MICMIMEDIPVAMSKDMRKLLGEGVMSFSFFM